MPLQRYEPHTYGSLLGESRILFEASDTGEWVKADEALAMVQELKCCGNCKHDLDLYEANCLGCREPELNKWEAR